MVYMNTIGVFMEAIKSFWHYQSRHIVKKKVTVLGVYLMTGSKVSQTGSNLCRTTQESLRMKKPWYLDLCFLFYACMNDICYTSGIVKTILFADDTTWVFFFCFCFFVLFCFFIHTKMFKHCVNWRKFATGWGQTTLNAKKIMFLGTPFQTNNITESYEIYLDICKLACLEVKFLGITIGQQFLITVDLCTIYLCWVIFISGSKGYNRLCTKFSYM